MPRNSISESVLSADIEPAAVGGLGELEPAALLMAASKEAGLEDFGDMSFMESLTQLMSAIVTEAKLSPMGLLGTRANVIRCLVNRLRVQQDIKRYPEIFEEDISDPIVIVGLPRTGSSKLQRMMSRDPAVQRLSLWRLLYPAPLPGWKRGEPDERIAMAQKYAQAMAQNPDFIASHPMAAEETDEDIFLMEMAFEGIHPLAQYHVPSYHAWVKDRPKQRFYAFEKVLLQYLQWQDGGRRDRPWILKAQTHLGGLQALVDTFPGVTIVHCHRDVSTALASTMRADEELRILLSKDVDLRQLGSDIMSIYTHEISRYLPQRERLDKQLRILDVRYDDIVADPMTVIRTIREVHGLPVTAEGARAMLGWGEENPQYRFGKNTYSLERYGLTKAQVEDSFADYRNQFGAWL